MRRIVPIIRQWWYRLWIREDEFDVSLNLDIEYTQDIQKNIDYWTRKLKWYHRDLCIRRDSAHKNNMEKMERKS